VAEAEAAVEKLGMRLLTPLSAVAAVLVDIVLVPV